MDGLLVAGYQRLPHWFFVHGRNHITLHYSRRGMRMLAPPDVWDADADLLNLGDGEVIAGRLERLGWRRRPSYGFTGPGAAVYITLARYMWAQCHAWCSVGAGGKGCSYNHDSGGYA